MKILLCCINLNGYGGSEMYHYELARELKLSGHDATLFTLRSIDPFDEKRVKLNDFGIKQLDKQSLQSIEGYDIIVVSQPETTQYLLSLNPKIPVISIIHSEVRAEDPVLHPGISHYIAIRQPISDLLITGYKIPSSKVSLIYNPIDQKRFNTEGIEKLEKVSGIFVGNAGDSLRTPTIRHLVDQCIDNDWDLYIMSDTRSRIDFNHPNVKYLDQIWHTEKYVKQMHFTAGILLGRTTLEGWCCGVPGYIYNIDRHGQILSVDSEPPTDIIELCNSTAVCKEHLELYSRFT